MATILFFLGFLAVVVVAVVIARRSGDASRRVRGGHWAVTGQGGSGPYDASVDYNDGGGSSWGGDGGGWSGGGDGGGGGGGSN
jgi:uncharacterized protein